MRSSAGVGMTPPKVEGAAKPTSSVMMSRMFGAPFGGTTRGGHQGFDCAALSSIWPPNFGGGGGSTRPSIVDVALGDPGAPVVCSRFGVTGAAAGTPTDCCALAAPSDATTVTPAAKSRPSAVLALVLT